MDELYSSSFHRLIFLCLLFELLHTTEWFWSGLVTYSNPTYKATDYDENQETENYTTHKVYVGRGRRMVGSPWIASKRITSKRQHFFFVYFHSQSCAFYTLLLFFPSSAFAIRHKYRVCSCCSDLISCSRHVLNFDACVRMSA